VGHDLYVELEKRGWKEDFLKVIKNWWENYYATLYFMRRKAPKGWQPLKKW